MRCEEERSSVRKDHNGIGGFFEDLPVLLFVLLGSLLLVATNAWITVGNEASRAARFADEEAEDLVTSFLLSLRSVFGDEVSVDSVKRFNSSLMMNDMPSAGSWAISVTVIHPWQESVLTMGSRLPASCTAAGWHSRLINLRYGVAGCAVAEVVASVSSP